MPPRSRTAPVRARAPAPPTRAATGANRSAAGALRVLQRDPLWILLILRAYLGFTFVYAGVSKIGGRSFLDGSAPTSMHATLLAVRAHSPIGGLLGPVEHHSFAFGLLIAFGETAVGVGMLLGLFARVAALGGMLISLSLFLTVSWNATPWYTGADIVYLFAFTPVLLGGAGPLSADGWLVARRELDAGPDAEAADRSRRVIVAGLAALGGLIAIGAAGLVRRSSGGGAPAAQGSAGRTPPRRPSPTSTPPSTSAGPAGPVILAAGAVPVGGAAPATDPKTGDPMYVLQLRPGVYTGVDGVCPHQGCTVSFISGVQGFECPCHLSTFDPSGTVTRGPAATSLMKIPVAKSGGNIVRT
jgi:thiosulfate dehydrogenase [quinone] large subunit